MTGVHVIPSCFDASQVPVPPGDYEFCIAEDEHRLTRTIPTTPALQSICRRVCELMGRPDLTEGPWAVIHSEPGGPDQEPHYDYDPEELSACDPDARPASLLLGLSPECRLKVWDEDGRWSEVVYGVGDAVFFDGSLKHAGTGYTSPNTRLHCYLEVPGARHKADIFPAP